jgi:PTS system nitrogen regulatory IIA component
MAEQDFDIEGLAEYLHVGAAQIARLAERGKLPGRKVNGVWRFSPADIHHWLETRIGISDDTELVEMEGFLRPSPLDDETWPSIAEMLPIDAIEVPLQAKTRGSVITRMVEVAAQTGYLWDTQKMAEAVRQREQMHPTALENGVALLHPRRPMASILGEQFLAFGRTDRGIPFGGPRLTDLFFLICSLDDQGHLQTLARLSRLLNSEEFLMELRQAPDARAVHTLLEAREKVVEG